MEISARANFFLFFSFFFLLLYRRFTRRAVLRGRGVNTDPKRRRRRRLKGLQRRGNLRPPAQTSPLDAGSGDGVEELKEAQLALFPCQLRRFYLSFNDGVGSTRRALVRPR